MQKQLCLSLTVAVCLLPYDNVTAERIPINSGMQIDHGRTQNIQYFYLGRMILYKQ